MAIFESHPDRTVVFTDSIVNSWDTVVPEGAGHGEEFLGGVEQAIKELGVPYLVTDRVEAETLRPDERAKRLHVRVALHVRATEPPLNKFEMYFSAADFGKHLILSRIVTERLNDKHSPYEREVVSAYFSLMHSAMLGVVKKITDELSQDFSKINAETKGTIDIV